jgi:transketolase
VSGWFTDDTAARFRAYGWDVVDAVDGHDVDAVDRALAGTRHATRPTLVICRTTIGRGSPGKADSAEAHGAPLGAAEVEATRRALGWSHPPFEVPDEVRAVFDARVAGARREAQWLERFTRYAAQHPEPAREFERVMAGELPQALHQALERHLAALRARPEALATRQASQRAIAAFAPALPELVGGSADLTHSNLTTWREAQPVGAAGGGNYLSFGVREFGMAAVMNGMALHGGLIPFGGTFLVFSDYARNAIRMAALMRQRVIHVLTHDSVALGEDGPTHQPIEQLASLRLIPNLEVWRPCDAYETAIAWREALARRAGPSALVLSRQPLPAMARDDNTCAGVALGGYCLRVEGHPLALVIAATGSEVALAMESAALLEARGHGVRVLSLPCVERFRAQPAAFRAALLPPGIPVLGLEAGHPAGLALALGPNAQVHGIESFGESAPGPQVLAHFGFTTEAVVARALRCVAAEEAVTCP